MGAFAIWVLLEAVLSQFFLGNVQTACAEKRCILFSAGLPGAQMQVLHLEHAAPFVTCRNTELLQ